MEQPKTIQEKIALAQRIAMAAAKKEREPYALDDLKQAEASVTFADPREEFPEELTPLQEKILEAKEQEEEKVQNDKWKNYKTPYYFLNAVSSDAKLKIIPCPNRVGKSTLMVFEAFRCAMNMHPHQKFKVPNSSWLIGPTLSHVQEVLVAEMYKWGIDSFWKKYSEKTGKITWINGSTTYVKSYDNRKNLQGRSLRKIFMDEEVPDDIWHELLMRCTADQPLELFVAATPIACEEWFCDLCDRGESGEPGIYVAPPITIWDAAVSKGGHLSDANIATISQLCTDENERNVRLYGKRVKRASSVLPLDEAVHGFDPDVLPGWVNGLPPVGWVIALGHDPHPRKPASIVWIAIDPETDDAYVFDYREIHDPIRDQVAELKRVNGDLKIFAIFMDPAAGGCMNSDSIYEGWNYYDDFCNHYTTVPVILSQKERGTVIASIKNRLVYDYLNPISKTNKPHLYISTKLVSFWKQLKGVRYKEYRDRKLQGSNEKVEVGKDDAMMALGYAIVMLPQYISHGLSEEYIPGHTNDETLVPEMGY